MKVDITVNDLARELQRQLATRVDYVVDTRKVGFHHDEPTKGFVATIDGAEGEFPIGDHVHDQIGQRLGIPSRFYDRLAESHPDMLVYNVTTLFNREHENRMLRTLDGRLRAFLSDRYRRLDNYDLLEHAILPGITDAPGAQIFSASVTDLRMYLKVVFPEIKLPVKDGDEVSPGIAISNSEVGAGSLRVEPFTYRWICTNGMIMGVQYADGWGLKKQHVGRRIEESDVARGIYSDETQRLDDAAFFAMAKDLVTNAASAIRFADMVKDMQALAGTKVDGDPVRAVEVLAQRHSLTEPEQGSVMRHLIEGGDLSAWGYVNAVTRTAEDAGSYDRATELERLGGDLLAAPRRAWETLSTAAA